MRNRYLRLPALITASLMSLFLVSYKQSNKPLSKSQSEKIKTEVINWANKVAENVPKTGSFGFLDNFEDSPGFFIANSGHLRFTTYHEDDLDRRRYGKEYDKFSLKFSDIRIEPITPEFATMAAIFHEEQKTPSGTIYRYDGYFTAVVHKTKNGWKFRNEHMSVRN